MWFSGELTRRFGPEYVKLKRTLHDDKLRYERYIEPVVGDVPVADLTGERAALHADAIIEKMFELSPGARPATRRQILQVYNRILNLSVFPLRLLLRNDLPKGYMPTVKTDRAFSYLYPDEEARLLGCTKVPIQHRLGFGILAREGMRRSSMRDLKWDDVDLERGMLRLDHNKTDDPAVWKMDPGTTEALRRWRKMQAPVVREAGYIVANPASGRRFPRTRSADVLRDALKKAGVKRKELFQSTDARMAIRLHDLRSTFVTISLALGKTEAWVTDRTGHKSSQMLYRYKRAARTHAEAELGPLVSLHEAIPELAERR